jgi:superfamily I DNA/RNA helicase
MILGRNIGKGLISLINRRAKLKRVQKLPTEERLVRLFEELKIYLNNEKAKLFKAGKFSHAQMLEDQVETIMAIADGCQTIQGLKSKISSTFSDDLDGVVFSSIHKAKGLEWDKVYILRPDLMPHPIANDRQQEENIRYVAYTRSKDKLYFVKGE